MLGRLAQRQLMLDALEAVAAVGEPVWPRDQRRSMRAVADVLDRVGLQHLPLADGVFAHAGADLDDRGALLAASDLELLTRRYERHRQAA